MNTCASEGVVSWPDHLSDGDGYTSCECVDLVIFSSSLQLATITYNSVIIATVTFS